MESLDEKFAQQTLSSWEDGIREHLLSLDELTDMPVPEWLVQDIMLQKGFTLLYAAPESYKSFLALDWAMCIASGIPWLGRPTSYGPVVYSIGEGVAGMGARALTWTHHRNPEEVPNILFHKRIVQMLNNDDVDTFIAMVNRDLKGEKPQLVVIDTLSRSLAGGDENSSTAMGTFVHNVSKIQRELDTSVLAVHHTRKDDNKERGHTALDGAVDTKIFLDKQAGNMVRVSCTKQKDFIQFADITLKLMAVDKSAVLVNPLQYISDISQGEESPF